MAFESRDLGGKDGSMVSDLTAMEVTIIESLGLAAAAISTFSALLAIYWFLKMRRSFRHGLIMLLIVSDITKSLCYLAYPIVTNIHGHMDSRSKFCQISGFVAAFGMEAGDVAILLIAIHTALYVFGHRANSWDGGLYPYRRMAYAAWLAFPALAASLAFINYDGYVAQGDYCYLPVRPYWYRLALSCVPRYIIFLTILGLYIAIYFYVNNKLHGFRSEGAQDIEIRKPTQRDQEPFPVSKHRDSVPPMPRLNLHGLLPESGPASVVKTSDPKSISTVSASMRTPKSPEWRMPYGNHQHGTVAASELPELVSDKSNPCAAPPALQPQPRAVTLAMSPPQDSLQFAVPIVSRLNSPTSTTTDGEPVIKMSSFLRQHHSGPTSPILRLRLVNSIGEDLRELDLIETRNRFRRQLHFLFVYPLVHMGMWTFPLIYSILLYNDKFAKHPPYILRCISTVAMCLQGAVDCWLFSSREKPWRHIPGHSGSFLGSLQFWSHWSELRKRYAMRPGPGKTREEIHKEAAIAYLRRKEEMTELRNMFIKQSDDNQVCRQQEKSWWDTTLSVADDATYHMDRGVSWISNVAPVAGPSFSSTSAEDLSRARHGAEFDGDEV